MNQSVEQRLKEIEEVTPPKQSCECPDCETIRFLLALCKKRGEALEFYADKTNWDDDYMIPTIWDDGNIDLGKRACKALNFDPSEDTSGGEV